METPQITEPHAGSAPHPYPIAPINIFPVKKVVLSNPRISPKLHFEFHAFQTSPEFYIGQLSLLSFCVINISFHCILPIIILRSSILFCLKY